MFAYCRNNPVCRIDISGAADVDHLDADQNPTTDEKGNWGKPTTGGSNGPSLTYLGGKSCPNPDGKLGGTLHRGLVDSLRGMFIAFGFDVPVRERRVYYDDLGHYRYPDLIVQKDGKDVVYVQVGKTT